MSLHDMLDKLLTLKRGDHTTDDVAGGVPTYPTVNGMVDVPCAVWPASSRTTREFQGDQMSVDHEIATDVDIGAKREDIVVIAGRSYLVAGYKPFDNENMGDPVFITVAERIN